MVINPTILHQEEQKPIKLAISLWAGDSHAFLAQDLGIFKKNGVDVRLIYSLDYPDSQALYTNQQVDGLFGTLSDAIYYDSTGVPSKIVYITDFSDGADVIVGNVTSLEELRGKVIGIENPNSYSHIFVLAALQKYGMGEQDVFFKQVPAHQVLEALDAGIITAGHTWEPTTTDAKNHGYQVVFSTRQMPTIIPSTLMIDSKVIEKRPEDIKNIVKSLVEAQEYRDAHKQKAIEIMARSQNVTFSDIDSGFIGIDTLDLDENYNMFYNSTEFKKDFEFISDFYFKRGIITETPEFEKILDGKFIKELVIER